MSQSSQDAPHSGAVHRFRIDRDQAGLSRVGARPSLAQYLRQIWDYRSFMLFDSQSRITSGTTEDSLGRIWMILNPILLGATYFLVFGVLLGTGRGIENFIGYLIIGVFMFRFTAQSITSGARAISNNQAVVRAFTFPRATLPLAVNVRELMIQVPVFITMIVLILVIPPLEPITWLWLLFIPLVVVQFLFNLGLSLILARLVEQANDVIHLISFGTRVWLYLSAVFFSIERFENQPVLVQLMELNPMYCILDIARDCLLYASVPPAERWLVLGAWTLAVLVIGTIVFWRAEERYGRER